MNQKTLKEAVHQVYRWQADSSHSCFSNRLFSLLDGAEQEDRNRLMLAYPELVTAFLLWEAAPDKDEFFEQFIEFFDPPKYQAEDPYIYQTREQQAEWQNRWDMMTERSERDEEFRS